MNKIILNVAKIIAAISVLYLATIFGSSIDLKLPILGSIQKGIRNSHASIESLSQSSIIDKMAIVNNADTSNGSYSIDKSILYVVPDGGSTIKGTQSVYWYHIASKTERLAYTIKNKDIIELNPHKYSYEQDSDAIVNLEFFKYARIKSLRLLPDSSIVFNMKHGPLYRINSEGLTIANEDFIFHHSIEIDTCNEIIWTCALPTVSNGKAELDNLQSIPFNIVGLDYNTFEVKYDIPVHQIVAKEPKLLNIARNHEIKGDIYHLNDVEPNPYNCNEIAISLRNINSVLIYNVKDQAIVKSYSYDFLQQHDVDFISQNEIAVFSNNFSNLDSELNNSIVKINTLNDSCSLIVPDYFEEHEIRSKRQGLFDLLDEETLFIEETTHGVYHLVNLNTNDFYQFIPKNGKNESVKGSWAKVY